jgi:hypothetical protein
MNTEHPLSNVFDIEYSIDDHQELISAPSTEVAVVEGDDEEDIEIKGKIDKIYTTAMTAYEDLNETVETVEPRYLARIGEVSNQFLNTALNAAALRSRNKTDKRKNSQFIPYNNITNSNVVVASRNDLLDMISERKKTETNHL